MDEIWKQIEGHPSLFVSMSGGIKKYNGHVYKSSIDNHGYEVVRVKENGTIYRLRVHRIVAKAFLQTIPGKNQVNHIDGNKTNNNVDNLEWCTSSENHWHRVHVLGKKPSYHKRVKVVCVETGMEFESVEDAARTISGSSANIIHCCNGKRKTHKGYHWKYL